MQCETNKVGNVTIFAIYGKLTFSYLGDIRETIKKDIATAATPKFLIDLTNMSSIDSSGLGTIVSIYKTVLSRNGTFGVLVKDKDVREVFHTIGLTKLFSLYEVQEEAIRELQ